MSRIVSFRWCERTAAGIGSARRLVPCTLEPGLDADDDDDDDDGDSDDDDPGLGSFAAAFLDMASSRCSRSLCARSAAFSCRRRCRALGATAESPPVRPSVGEPPERSAPPSGGAIGELEKFASNLKLLPKWPTT